MGRELVGTSDQDAHWSAMWAEPLRRPPEGLGSHPGRGKEHPATQTQIDQESRTEQTLGRVCFKQDNKCARAQAPPTWGELKWKRSGFKRCSCRSCPLVRRRAQPSDLNPEGLCNKSNRKLPAFGTLPVCGALFTPNAASPPSEEPPNLPALVQNCRFPGRQLG